MQGNLLFCCDCQNAFHQNCHGPSTLPNDKNSNGRWICKRCTDERSQQTSKQSPLRSQEKQTATLPHIKPEMQEAVDDEGYQEFAGFSDNEIRKDSFSLTDAPINEGCSSLEKIKDETTDSRYHLNDDQESKEECVKAKTTKHKLDPRLDNFENVESWTCDDVFQYFQYYFPEYAHLFKEQVIFYLYNKLHKSLIFYLFYRKLMVLH